MTTTTKGSDTKGTGAGTRPEAPRNDRSRLIPILVVVALAAGAVLAAGVLIARADDAEAWADVRARCEQVSGSFGEDAGRCDEMVRWMADGHRNGRMADPGMMMRDGAMMRSACQRWVDGPGAGRDERAQGWCDGMAGTMPHGSMMPGPMMPGPMMPGR